MSDDAMTSGPSPYVEPALTVRATYHASDGRVPEEITIEVGRDQPIDPDLVDRAVAALARVAHTGAFDFARPTLGLVEMRDDIDSADLAAAGARQAGDAAVTS